MKTASATITLAAVALGWVHGLVFGAAQREDQKHSQMTLEKIPFGTTKDGQAVELYTLNNANGVAVKVITYGAIIYSVETPDRTGKRANINANLDSVADYEDRSPCFGAVVGRYANRIAKGQFRLGAKHYRLALNNGPNHLHGGIQGFHKRVWKAEPVPGTDSAALRLTYVSTDGEEGYPGTLRCTILYELNNRNEWKMDYTASSDQPTVVNLSNHSYWNLAGAQSGSVLDQVLTLNADQYLPADEGLIPTGELAPVDGTPLDFRTPHAIGSRMNQIQGKQFGGGYDHCLAVNHKLPGDLVRCATLKDPQSGRTMEVFTTEPGVQIFSANFGGLQGPKDYVYPKHLGLCLETQHFPDSPNRPNFPSTTLLPGQTFRSTTIHKFGVDK
jgi:aldose 1-epimerase